MKLRFWALGFTGWMLGACGVEEPARPRAVLIGVDSADWMLIDQLVSAGDMPHLAGLQERGVRGELQTLTDIPLSPVVWTSVATGKVPVKHGVTWFLVDEPDGTRVPVRSTNRRAEALWTILDREGKSACSVGWWATYPAEALENGLIVSDAMGFHGFGSSARGMSDDGKVSPAGLYPEIDALMPTEQQIGSRFVQRFVDISDADFAVERFDPARSGARNPLNPMHLFQQYAVTAQGYTAIAEKVLGENGFDLFLVYYEQTDSFSHLFMKYDKPKLPWVDRRGVERYSRTVREWYRYQDELLGRLLAKIDLETTAVFVVSDHGFKTGDRRIRSEKTVDAQKAHLDHETDGIFLAAGPGIRRGARVTGATVLDGAPTLLHYLDVPVGKDMDGRVLTEALEPALMQSRPIRYVATHESRGQAAEATLAKQGGSNDWEDGLRALGYMGAASEGEPEESDLKGEGEPAGSHSSPEIHNNLGRMHLGRGEIDQALAEFRKALALDPNSADALLAIGSVFQARGQVDLATYQFERALAVDPNSIGALAQLAGMKRDAGDLVEAARLYREALALNDASPGLYVGFGDVLQRSGELPSAEAVLRRALELDPDNAIAHYNLGVTYEKMGRSDEAVEMYEQSLELGADHSHAAFAMNNLGAIHRDRGDPERALTLFEGAAKRFPKHIESRFNAAMIHLTASRFGKVISLLEEAAAVDPSHELVHQQLGLTYLFADRTEDAYRPLLLVRRRYPANWRATVGLAVVQAARRETADAKLLLKEAVSLGGADARAFAARFPRVSAWVEAAADQSATSSR